MSILLLTLNFPCHNLRPSQFISFGWKMRKPLTNFKIKVFNCLKSVMYNSRKIRQHYSSVDQNNPCVCIYRGVSQDHGWTFSVFAVLTARLVSLLGHIPAGPVRLTFKPCVQVTGSLLCTHTSLSACSPRTLGSVSFLKTDPNSFLNVSFPFFPTLLFETKRKMGENLICVGSICLLLSTLLHIHL